MSEDEFETMLKKRAGHRVDSFYQKLLRKLRLSKKTDTSSGVAVIDITDDDNDCDVATPILKRSAVDCEEIDEDGEDDDSQPLSKKQCLYDGLTSSGECPSGDNLPLAHFDKPSDKLNHFVDGASPSGAGSGSSGKPVSEPIIIIDEDDDDDGDDIVENEKEIVEDKNADGGKNRAASKTNNDESVEGSKATDAGETVIANIEGTEKKEQSESENSFDSNNDEEKNVESSTSKVEDECSTSATDKDKGNTDNQKDINESTNFTDEKSNAIENNKKDDKTTEEEVAESSKLDETCVKDKTDELPAKTSVIISIADENKSSQGESVSNDSSPSSGDDKTKKSGLNSDSAETVNASSTSESSNVGASDIAAEEESDEDEIEIISEDIRCIFTYGKNR